MFTGLVQALGIVIASTPTAAGRRMIVSMAELAGAKVAAGDSVCVCGVCLTAVTLANNALAFDVITETLHHSTLGNKKAGDRVNLELSLQPTSFVGGHFVQGHVDAVGEVAAVERRPEDWRITTRVPVEAMPLMVPKGSVAIEGVSMTIAHADARANTFTLAVIPTTLERTTLGSLAAGDAVNIETDILARTVVHYLRGLGGPMRQDPGITMAKLLESGFV